ncbi:MAG: hypothetical protein RLZZ399_2173 [Verrucomicrobiota bacterium]|jgi:hypothetical protein
MAAPSWLRIYRSYSTPLLQKELARLREQLQNPYGSTGSGGISASRDLTLLQNQLDGATRAMDERNGRSRRVTRATFGA